MKKPLALPYPRFRIEDGEISGAGLISISASSPSPGESAPLALEKFGSVLHLKFDDIPCAEMRKDGKVLKGPKEDHIRKALGFAREVLEKHPDEAVLIAVHCFAGKSRSAAMALAINASLSTEPERETVAALLAYDPQKQMCFNPGVIRLAEKVLGTEGRLERALEELCPAFRGWRRHWEKELQGLQR